MKTVIYEKGQWKIFIGADPSKGGTFIGPFPTKESAEEYLPQATGGIPLVGAYKNWLELHPTLESNTNQSKGE